MSCLRRRAVPVIAVLFASACAAEAPEPPRAPAAPAAIAPPAHEARMTAEPRKGTLLTYKSGTPVGRERFEDDGERLVSRLSIAGVDGTITVQRSPRHVIVESGGRSVERDVDASTVVLENGSWQAYALAAEWFPDASSPTPVTVLVPGQGARLPATLTVTPASGGGKRVVVSMGPLVVHADVDAAGLVTRAEVPAQGLEARPEGQPAPVTVERPAPKGVTSQPIEAERGGATLRGELWRPAGAAGKLPVVVMIAGSGPTDRDGNSALGLRTDGYRKLALALAGRDVASIRYDKRGIGASSLGMDPSTITLDDFVKDADAVVQRARADATLGPVVVLGHSEGGLIALLLAARSPPDALVLLATPGRPVGAVLREQLARSLDAATMADADRILAALRTGAPVEPVPPALAPLFPKAVRAFLQSELDLDPVPLLRALTLPVAIVQGAHDAQVTPADARLLAAARPDARLTLLPKMSHVFVDEASSDLPQPGYSDPSLPLSAGLVDAVVAGVRAKR